MTSRPFARILLASDGEQVLFMLNINEFSGEHQVTGYTRCLGDRMVAHIVQFEDPEQAYTALAAFDVETADVMRTVAASAQKGVQ